MSKLIVTRIDDRLIHGQVMTGWVKQHKIDQIIIVDDGLRNDDFMKSVLEMAIPAHMTLDVYDLVEAIDKLKNIENDGHDYRVLILTKGPIPILKLVENKVAIEEVIVGGMGVNESRQKIYRNIAASGDEVTALKTLSALNIPITFKLLPNDAPVDMMKFI